MADKSTAGSATLLQKGVRAEPRPAPTQASANEAARAAEEAVIERISADLHRPLDDVRRLYLSELAALRSSARLQTYVSVIATKRVKAALRASAAADQPVP